MCYHGATSLGGKNIVAYFPRIAYNGSMQVNKNYLEINKITEHLNNRLRTEQGGSMVMLEARIREVPGSNPMAGQPA